MDSIQDLMLDQIQTVTAIANQEQDAQECAPVKPQKPSRKKLGKKATAIFIAQTVQKIAHEESVKAHKAIKRNLLLAHDYKKAFEIASAALVRISREVIPLAVDISGGGE